MKSGKKIATLLIALLPVMSGAQEKATFRMNGYLTSLQSVLFENPAEDFLNDNLLHNRLNFSASLEPHFRAAVEIRNRFFTGDRVKADPGYALSIARDPGWMTLSLNLLEERSYFINSTIDRLSFDIVAGKSETRIGRQRINWGQALIWNPNDIFNAYSFFDFDYVEKPGSDAIRFQWFPSQSSVVELAASLTRHRKTTVAGLWRFNRKGYDLQFLGGYADSRDLVAGTGWSGNIGATSFRGEATFFQPTDKDSPGKSLLLVTAGLDRVLKDNSMVMGQLMFCTHPPGLDDFATLYSGTLSARHLAFSRFTAFGQFSWAVSPLVNLTASAMWFPDLKGCYAGPT